MDTMGQRLRNARIKAGFSSATKAADAIGISHSTYRAHENGQNEFGPQEAVVYGRKFDVSASYLLTGEETVRRKIISSFDPDMPFGLEEDAQVSSQLKEGQIPEIEVKAGMGGGGEIMIANQTRNSITISTEVIRDYWRLPDNLLAKLNVVASNVAVLPAYGDSMAPTINDGDAVFIDISHDELGGVIIKRLEIVSRPGAEEIAVEIISDNPHHKPRILNLDEIVILGRYIGRFTR
ncbi:LexA family transcriptional regulator [uncultured Bartonella sp.]|uniref:S24 family peptidase n=1 Tax=uncultured Bartonella sp. TaxID=104108 RepID=UPI00262E1CA9|nr:LexA family transcriptional regulator [uncultured Bartonella sp.]